MINKNLRSGKGFKHMLGITFNSLLSAFIAYGLTEKIDIDYYEYFQFFSYKIEGDILSYSIALLVPFIIFIMLFIYFLKLSNKISEKNTKNVIIAKVGYLFDFGLSIFSAGIGLSLWQLFFYEEGGSCKLLQFNCFFSGIFISFMSLIIFLIFLIFIIKVFYNKNK